MWEDGDLFFVLSIIYIGLVVIDFGIIFSGFVFVFNYKEGEKGIYMNKEWGVD